MSDIIQGHSGTVSYAGKILQVEHWEAEGPKANLADVAEAIKKACGRISVTITSLAAKITKLSIFFQYYPKAHAIRFQYRRTRKLQRRYGPVFREMMRVKG